MANTMVCQGTILRVLLQITLLAMFIGFFGVPSLIRYQDSKVMVVVEEKDTAGIPAPALTICARDERETKIISDACNRSVNVFSCMQSESWSMMKYVVLDAGKGWPAMKELMGAQFWGLQIRSRFECFTLSINELIGPLYQRDILRFVINNTTRIYELFIHSSDFFIPNWNRLIMPINRFKVFPKTDCSGFVTISLIEKHELNTVQDPCEESKEYNFTRCIQQSIATQAGCDGKESCVTGEQFR